MTSRHSSHDQEYPKLPEDQDRRIKIKKEDHEYIRQRHFGPEKAGVRALAREYGVDKRLIGFILHPERYEQNLARRKERGGWAAYYDKNKHREYMQKHRRHKAEIQREEVLDYRRKTRKDTKRGDKTG